MIEEPLKILYQYINLMPCCFCRSKGSLQLKSQIIPPFKEDIFLICSACINEMPIFKNTMFEKLLLCDIFVFLLIFLFVTNSTIQEIAKILKLMNIKCSRKTLFYYYKKLLIISNKFYENTNNYILMNGEMEIDESHFYIKKKSKAVSRNYKSNNLWVFAIKKRNSEECFVQILRNRKASTIHPLIIAHIKKYSTIYSDCFGTYVNTKTLIWKSKLEGYGFIHYWVNHSQEYVSYNFPHIHTNGIERLWEDIKTDLRKHKIKKNFTLYLGYWYFRRNLTIEKRIQYILFNILKI